MYIVYLCELLYSQVVYDCVYQCTALLYTQEPGTIHPDNTAPVDSLHNRQTIARALIQPDHRSKVKVQLVHVSLFARGGNFV